MMKAMAPLTIFDPEEGIPEDAQKIKHLGCPDTIMNKACVAVLKANDDMHRDNALPHAFRALSTEGEKQ